MRSGRGPEPTSSPVSGTPQQAGRACAHSPLSGESAGFVQNTQASPGQRGRTLKNSGIFHNFFLVTKLRHFIITLSKKKSPVNKIKMISSSNAWWRGVCVCVCDRVSCYFTGGCCKRLPRTHPEVSSHVAVASGGGLVVGPDAKGRVHEAWLRLLKWSSNPSLRL